MISQSSMRHSKRLEFRTMKQPSDAAPMLRLIELLGQDPFPKGGLLWIHAKELLDRHHPPIDPSQTGFLIFPDGFPDDSGPGASQISAVLCNQYPPDHPIQFHQIRTRPIQAHAVPASDSEPNPAPAPDSDLQTAHGVLADLESMVQTSSGMDLDPYFSCLQIPPLESESSLLDLAEIIAYLRAPDGCPWDREQTHLSLRPYLLEECYEALEALDAGSSNELCEELGDLLLQITLHAQIAQEAKDFGIADIVRGISRKLIRRHPHVFGDVEANDSTEVLSNWEALKRAERAEKGEGSKSLFDGLPIAMPALARAQAVQRRAKRIGSGTSFGESEFKDRDQERLDKNSNQVTADTVEIDSLLRERGDQREDQEAERSDTDQDLRSGDELGRTLWQIISMIDAQSLDAETLLREETARFVQKFLDEKASQ